MKRKPVLTLTKDDFIVSYFTAGGPGGGGKDTSNTACRITHKETGLMAKAQEHRSQRQNKIAAFTRLIEQLKPWLKRKHYQKVTNSIMAEDWVEQQMAGENIITEVKVENRWQKINPDLLTK